MINMTQHHLKPLKLLSQALLIIAVLMLTVSNTVVANEQSERPPASIKPYEMMAQLSDLAGQWEMQTLYTADKGKNWQDMGKTIVEIGYTQKDLMMYERPVELSKTGFNMASFITFDQYRNVFRKAAIDDVWGVMDLYTGNIEGSRLILTNLELGTLFPEPDGKKRGFRLSLELNGERRIMLIEATLDNGKTWFPNFKNIYVKKN